MTNRERVILPFSQSKIKKKKNTLFIDQSAFSKIAPYVIIAKSIVLPSFI